MRNNNTSGSSRKTPSGKVPWKAVALLIVVVGLLAGAKIFHLDAKILQLKDWILGLGALAPLAYILIYIIAVVAAIPGSAITIAGGALFGSLKGTILVSIASTAGAGLAFLISRYVARDAVASWLEKNEKFQKLDMMTEKRGAVIVALTRLVPIFPFNLLNYGFGLTRVKFTTYIFWSWLCMLPGTILYVAGADALSRSLTSGKIPWKIIALTLGAGIILFFLVKLARKSLQSEEDAREPDEGKEKS